MLFNSIEFLLFLPIVLFGYFLIPVKQRWGWLLGASYFFYMSWEPIYALLIMLSTFITYMSGILLHRERAKKQYANYDDDLISKRKKLWVFLSFFINLAILVYFKYYNFLLDSFLELLVALNFPSLDIPFSQVLLPVGISFYTFQALSYTIDVYRGDIEAERHFGYYALFVSFFPQLVAGPIERSSHLLPQLRKEQEFNYERMKSGLILMGWGFIKKIVIADRLAVVVNTVYGAPAEYNGFTLVVATLFFSFQIYCDFSAYSDIAIGVARIMGINLMKNFQTPYFSRSISEFWRRWHISLGGWFREYLYIPLGGSKVSLNRTYVNLTIVFLVSGLWHGANWTFLIWGALHAFFQIFGKITKPIRIKICNKLSINREAPSHVAIQAIITFSLVSFAWIFFRANSLSDAVYIVKNLSLDGLLDFLKGGGVELGLDLADLVVGIISIVGLLLLDYQSTRTNLIGKLQSENLPFRWFVYYGIIFTIIILGYYGGFDESSFIYFQF